MIGQRFGRLTVESFAETRRYPSGKIHKLWKVVCDCGNSKVVQRISLTSGKTLSCRCLNKETQAARLFRHGIAKHQTRAYHSWLGMRTRCLSENANGYSTYGGRGITITERWNDFNAFLADMGEPPLGHSLDRIDTNGNYCPENCRWATPKQQSRNRRDNFLVTIGQETKCLAEWCETMKLDYKRVSHKIHSKGMDPIEALGIKPYTG